MVNHPLDVSIMCYLIRPIQPLYPVPVRWNRVLQSRFLHSMPHGKRACDLLCFGLRIRAQGTCTLWNNMVSSIPMPMLGTHIIHQFMLHPARGKIRAHPSSAESTIQPMRIEKVCAESQIQLYCIRNLTT
jgi:hypothetical protein